MLHGCAPLTMQRCRGLATTGQGAARTHVMPQPLAHRCGVRSCNTATWQVIQPSDCRVGGGRTCIAGGAAEELAASAAASMLGLRSALPLPLLPPLLVGCGPETQHHPRCHR